MTFESFCEKFEELDNSVKVSIYREYLVEQGDEPIWNFDEEFFDVSFSNPMDAARATYFGEIQSWSDEYIRFNAYGNLESLSEHEVLGEIEDYMEEIYDNGYLWSDYIEDDDEDEEEEYID